MELKLSDEQYEKIGRESVAEWQKSFHPNTKSAYIAVGRAAVEAVLAEVLPVVLAPMNDEEEAEYLNSDVSDSFEWVRKHRLARFTAPKDEAVEAVRSLLAGTYLENKNNTGFIEKIVAAVRAADQEAGR